MSLKNFMSYEDAATVLGEYADKVNELKSGLINYQTQNDLNLEVPNRKNVLPLTIAEIKKSSTAGTWSGNNYTINGVTFAVITDENGVVTSVNATGIASADAVLVVSRDINLDAGNYTINGCHSGGSSSTYEQYITTPYTEDVGNGVDFAITSQKPTFAIKIINGYAIPSGGLSFQPMIRPASVTDPTFAPYIPSVESRIEAVESGLTNVTPTLIASSSATGTYGDKLGELAGAYNNMSNAQKIKSYMMIGDVRYNVTSTGMGWYESAYFSDANTCVISVASIDSSIGFKRALLTSNGVSIVDRTTTEDSTVFKLYA